MYKPASWGACGQPAARLQCRPPNSDCYSGSQYLSAPPGRRPAYREKRCRKRLVFARHGVSRAILQASGRAGRPGGWRGMSRVLYFHVWAGRFTGLPCFSGRIPSRFRCCPPVEYSRAVGNGSAWT